MNKIIGCLIAWGAKDFIGPALQQAVEYCDEVFVCVAPHSKSMEAFEDGTTEIAYQFARRNSKVKTIPWEAMSFHAPTKANILNTMLSKSELREPGNWIWILDVDEFYPKRTYNQVRAFVEASDKFGWDLAEFQEYYFYINTQYYLKGSHLRLFKIKHEQNIFQPTQRWIYAEKPIIFDMNYVPMYHYGMLTNPHAKMAFWGEEYPGQEQDNKVEWIDYIYRNYNLDNQDFWIDENAALFDVASPWFSDSFEPTMQGTLYEYDQTTDGPHPEFIGKDLLEETDFRVKYDFLPNNVDY